jgi:hypothetical protein
MSVTLNKEVIIDFQGELSFDTIGDLINQLKTKSESLNLKISGFKSVLSATIESLENIYKYQSHLPHKPVLDPCFLPHFKLERLENEFFLTACNAVLNMDVAVLRERLELINSLDEAGLKELYKSTITNGQFSRKGGAGLGFMEMIKLSGEQLVFDFEYINQQYSYFSLQVAIPIARHEKQQIS